MKYTVKRSYHYTWTRFIPGIMAFISLINLTLESSLKPVSLTVNSVGSGAFSASSASLSYKNQINKIQVDDEWKRDVHHDQTVYNIKIICL